MIPLKWRYRALVLGMLTEILTRLCNQDDMPHPLAIKALEMKEEIRSR